VWRGDGQEQADAPAQMIYMAFAGCPWTATVCSVGAGGSRTIACAIASQSTALSSFVPRNEEDAAQEASAARSSAHLDSGSTLSACLTSAPTSSADASASCESHLAACMYVWKRLATHARAKNGKKSC
jgi:hypothetical protein